MKTATEQYCIECCPIHYFTRLGFGKHFFNNTESIYW